MKGWNLCLQQSDGHSKTAEPCAVSDDQAKDLSNYSFRESRGSFGNTRTIGWPNRRWRTSHKLQDGPTKCVRFWRCSSWLECGSFRICVYGFCLWARNSNSNYLGGFTGVNGGAGAGGFAASSSGGLTGETKGLIPNPRKLTVAGGSVGVSLLGASGGVTATHYTKPLQLGRWRAGMGAIDIPLYLLKQVCE